jgi:uncharacterized protein (TIGR00269 family)
MDSRVVVAISGGKDSAALLHLISEILGVRRDLTLEAALVDEGIAGYREKTREKASELCESLGVTLHVRKFADAFGTTLDEMVERVMVKGRRGDDGSGGAGGVGTGGGGEGGAAPSPCGMCGVLRRRALNDICRETGADLLILGHNLDDMAQSVAMNLFNSELDRIARLGPHPPERVLPGLVPRRLPLRGIPEKETYLYAILRELQYADLDCPYAAGATRGHFRDMIDGMEDRVPGTRHRLQQTGDRIRELMYAASPPGTMAQCEKCGEPSSGPLCKVCDILGKVGGG